MRDEFRLVIEKLRGAASQLRFLPRTAALLWASSGYWTVAWLALLAVQGLLPVAAVYLTRPLVDGLSAAAAGDDSRIAPTMVLAGVMGGVLLLGELLRGVAGGVRTAQAKRVQDNVSSLIHAKSTRVDLGFYESPDFHDHLHRARDEAAYRPVALLENVGGLAQNAITLLAMAAVLLPYGAWMSAALLASSLPAFVVVVRHAVRHHRWKARVTSDERRAQYYDWLMTAGDTAAEVRLFGLGEFFRAAHASVRARLRDEELQMAWGQVRAELVAAALALLVAAACLAWMLWRALSAQVSLGDVALFYFAFSQGQRLMRALLGGVGHVYYNILFLGNLFAFLDLRAEVLDAPGARNVPPLAAGTRGREIRFREVAFRYPGSDRGAIEELSLTVPAGQMAAIVGPNGAGKSTLFKLLCRFYDPIGGRIELDGVDLRELSLQSLRGSITVLFQSPVRYNATVAENIAIGREPAAARADIEAAARAAGADEFIARLPHGYETVLGKWFAGGVELSVGEWQRIALARAFLRPAPLILLDEPTSAMDSWAEADWLTRLRTLATGRTTIIVTHRFTTAMQADVIHVMEGGRIVESGSHAQLVARPSAYARSWKAQMRAERSVPHGNA